MNRETKLGLIIGTSFVSLVAVVLFNTWNRPEESQSVSEPAAPQSTAAVSTGPGKGTTPTNNQITTVGAKQEAPPASVPASEPGKLPPTSSGWTAAGTPTLPPGPSLGPSSPPAMPPGYGQAPLPPPALPGGEVAHQGASLNGTERLIVMPEVEHPAIAYGELPTTQPVPLSPVTPPAGPPALDSKLLSPPPPAVLPGQPETSPIKLPAAGPPAGGSVEPVPPPPTGVGRSPDPMHIGSEATPSVGSIAVPPPVGVPPPALVESHTETLLVAGADEDFAKMSSRAFNTPDYGQALYAFNRDHPADPLAGLPPGTLKSGTGVYVPPVDVLKQKYGSLIKAAPVAAVTAPGNNDAASRVGAAVAPMPQYTSTITPMKSTPQDQIAAPPPPPQSTWTNATPPQPNPNKDVPAVSNSGPTGTSKPYWVPAGGKYYYEIARETLGDGTRWGDIWRLNTSYPPETQIPGGTQLRLPPDARVQ